MDAFILHCRWEHGALTVPIDQMVDLKRLAAYSPPAKPAPKKKAIIEDVAGGLAEDDRGDDVDEACGEADPSPEELLMEEMEPTEDDFLETSLEFVIDEDQKESKEKTVMKAERRRSDKLLASGIVVREVEASTFDDAEAEYDVVLQGPLWCAASADPRANRPRAGRSLQ